MVGNIEQFLHPLCSPGINDNTQSCKAADNLALFVQSYAAPETLCIWFNYIAWGGGGVCVWDYFHCG